MCTLRLIMSPRTADVAPLAHYLLGNIDVLIKSHFLIGITDVSTLGQHLSLGLQTDPLWLNTSPGLQLSHSSPHLPVPLYPPSALSPLLQKEVKNKNKN